VRQVVFLSLLLGLALTGSYLTWTAPAEEKPASAQLDAVVVDALAQDLTRVQWESDALSVAVERRTDARGDYLWVDATERKEVRAKTELAPEAPPADGAEPPAEEATPAAEDGKPAAEGEEAAPAPAEAPVRTEEKKASFRGGEASDKLWADLAPLHALRELVLPPNADLATYGLDKPKATITLTVRGAPVVLTLGGETYGAKDRYVQVGGRTYLLAQDLLRPLEFAATRLVERRLHPFAEDRLDQMTLRTAEGAEVTLVQTNKDDKEKAFWAKSSAPTEEYKAGDAWLGKLLKLTVKLYVDEATLAAPLLPAFSFTATSGSESWQVDVLKTDGPSPEYYARSTYDRGLVSLTRSLTAELSADLANVVQP
jgi:hypothetical protein